MTEINIFNPQNFSRELQLLLICMKAESEQSFENILQPWLEDVDWGLFLNLAKHHRVYPLIYMKLKNLKEGSIPLDVIQVLSQEYRKNTFQMLHLTGEMENIFRHLGELDIQALMLKGPVLAMDLYGDLSHRTSKDLDILVQQRDLKRTEEIILKLGYEKVAVGDHHFCYFHFKKAINIEIHWRLHPDLGIEPSFDYLWERRRITPLTSYPICFLGRDDLFLYLVPHGARHGWFRLRWLVDIDRLVRKGLNWGYLIPQLLKFQYQHIAGQALLLAQQILNTPFPMDIQIDSLIRGEKSYKLAHLAVFYIREIKEPERSNLPWNEYFHDKYYYFSLLPNLRLKMSYIIRHFKPQKSDRETMPLPKSMAMLYVILRPGLWMWRKINRV
ncbi:nucleotidyltransferase domain-containing protein [Neobacillus vireti]|uniref:nucleotidyltransferase domain-containing protein n=1 Tax=Neobacillus vireti TaxID=220686 RepID=UPI002FFE7762